MRAAYACLLILFAPACYIVGGGEKVSEDGWPEATPLSKQTSAVAQDRGAFETASGVVKPGSTGDDSSAEGGVHVDAGSDEASVGGITIAVQSSVKIVAGKTAQASFTVTQNASLESITSFRVTGQPLNVWIGSITEDKITFDSDILALPQSTTITFAAVGQTPTDIVASATFTLVVEPPK